MEDRTFYILLNISYLFVGVLCLITGILMERYLL